MSVAIPGNAPESFEIKSASLPLVALLLKTPDLDAVARDFADRYGDIPGFFDQDAMVIDLSRLDDSAEVDFDRLLPLLRQYRLVPVAVRGGSEAQRAAAVAAGLAEAHDARILTPPASKQETPRRAPEPEPVVAPGALVIDRPLRSGQQIYARGRDLVMLAMVNPGAEVIADGHIHVYAPLRGRAIAGARGNVEARIFSLALEPELIAIAGVYRTGEMQLPDEVRGRPTQVRLVSTAEGERLLLDPLRA